MSICLYCQAEMNHRLYWETMIQIGEPPLFCTSCSRQLIYLKGQCCANCSRESEITPCYDCSRWQQYDGGDPLEKNVSIYTYNEFMQEVITKWKYRGDYEVGYGFQSSFRQVFEKVFSREQKKLIAVPIPLGEKRGYDRAFNQAEMLARFLPVPMENVLQRQDSEKQSKKSRSERLSTSNPFILTKSLNKSVVLVDDIYTTGRTLRHAAETLKQHGSPKVYAITLIRG